MTPDDALTADDLTARRLATAPGLVWYHRFRLSRTVMSPGASDVQRILDIMCVPPVLTGLSVLDIGTIDGGFAFAAERRGASRVVATEFRPHRRYAFPEVAAAIGSRVEYVHASVYELPVVLRERFDLVFFRGALYHLRHPLLGIEAVRSVAAGRVVVETAVSHRESGAEFYPDAYRGDPSVWFIPSRRCALDWFTTCGFTTTLTSSWPQYPEHDRALLDARVNRRSTPERG